MPGRCFSEDGSFCLHDVAGFFQATFPQDKSLGLYLDWRGFFIMRHGGFQNGVSLLAPAVGALFADMSCARWQPLFEFRFCESLPFRLTGSYIFLHRQNALSVERTFTKKSFLASRDQAEKTFMGDSSAEGIAMFVEDAPYNMVATDDDFHDFLFLLRTLLCEALQASLQYVGEITEVFFRTLLLVTAMYVCKLQTYAAQL